MARSEAQIRVHSALSTITITQEEDIYEWWPNAMKRSSYSKSTIWLRATNLWSHGGVRFGFLGVYRNIKSSLLDRHPTRDRLVSWGFQTDTSCLLCNNGLESRNHLFCECDFSWGIWKESSRRCGILPHRNWDLILQQLKSYNPPNPARKLLLIAWQATLYLIWLQRNSRLHRHFTKPLTTINGEIDQLVRNRLSTLRPKQPSILTDVVRNAIKIYARFCKHPTFSPPPSELNFRICYWPSLGKSRFKSLF